MLRTQEKSPYLVERKKNTYTTYSEISLVSDKRAITFFAKKGVERRRQYASGYFSDVSPAYDSIESLNNNKPCFSIKKLRINGGLLQLETAKKEVDCHRALGRESYLFYGKHKLCILYNWQVGVTLYSLYSNLTAISEQLFIMWIESLLSSIQQLHALNIAHNDLNLANILVNTNDNTISLIDFGCAEVGDASAKYFTNDLRKILFFIETFIERRKHLFSTSDLLPTFAGVLSDNINRWSSKQAHDCFTRMNCRSSM